MPSCAVCNVEAGKVCSKCRKTSYCRVECQTKDWETHKKQCGKPQPSRTPVAAMFPNIPYPAAFSQFGQTFNVPTGESKPISHRAVFFGELLGFTPNEPKRVYEELVDAFRLLRLNDVNRDKAVNPSTAEFMDFMDKAKKADILPKWWQESVHGQDIFKFVQGDEWARLDRVVSAKDILAHHNPDGKQKPEMRLRMMAERVLG